MATPKKNTPKKPTPAKAAAKEKSKPLSKPAAAKPAKLALKSKPEPKSKSPVPPVKRSEIAPPPARPAPRPKVERPQPAPEPEVLEPQKPQVDEAWQKQMREMLAVQRQRLLNVVQSTQAHMAEKSGDLADISDRASEGFEDELAVGLMAIEAAQIDDINDAIERIDVGTYGLCADCGKAIPRKRLEILPFARRCLACEGQSERRSRAVEAEDDEEELD